jgi:mono/diheme cytochrome c family protein
VLLLAGLLLTTGCREKPISKVNFEEVKFAPFVEPDFPFVTTSMDGRKLGPGFPQDNIAARCLALQLGNEAYACFDMDMLRWSVAWTGAFLPMVTMAQISYNDFFNKNNKIPTIGGDPKIATGQYPGWGGEKPQFTDPRPPATHPGDLPWGPLPAEKGRWNGTYLVGKEVVLAYTVAGVDIFENPGSIKKEGEVAFTRTIQIGSPKAPLTMVAAEVTDGVRSEVSGNTAYIYHGPNGDKVTAIGLAGGTPGLRIEIIDNRYAVVQVAASKEELNFALVMWQGAVGQKGLFAQMLAEKKVALPNFRKGGPAHWKEPVFTRGQLSPDTAAFVTDQLTLPLPNPWNRNVRVVDVAFFDAKRAALVTFEGDVWLVDGIDRNLSKLKWRRYASGLYEPQSIEVVNGSLYVYGKEGIVRFQDLNGDGVADYYENFSNLMAQSIETREWASDMVQAPDGSFYVAKFGALDLGPEASSPKRLMGFRAGSPHDGSILKISPDGRSMETYATGFRGPYLGINPKTGQVSASDQQGNYMPSTPVMLVNKGDYYGVPATAHRDPLPAATPPLLWLPHRVDRSGISQVWVHSEKMGPLNGEMIHLSYGRPGLFRVMVDNTGEGVQGVASVLPGTYPAPTMKAAVNPGDGQLYVTGFSLWGSNSNNLSAFIRLRYTGQEALLPQKAQVREGGVLIRFGNELDEATATDPKNFSVKRWNYERTEKYGSGHFKPDGSVGEEQLPVLGAYLSDDRKALFLAVPNVEKVMQMEVSYDLKTAQGSAVKDVLWFTVNAVVKPDLAAEGFRDLRLEDLELDNGPAIVAESGEEPASVELGSQLFLKMGCIACHATDGNNQGRTGPGLKGLFGSERPFRDGTSAKADAAYIRESILKPGEKVVQGFEPGMPSFLGVLSDPQVESIVLYIKTL